MLWLGLQPDRLPAFKPALLTHRHLTARVLKHPVKPRTVVDFTAADDHVDRTGSPDIGQRVGIEHQQVGRLAGADAAVAIELAEKARAVHYRALQRLLWRQAVAHVQADLVVQRLSGIVVRVEETGVGAGDDTEALLRQQGQQLGRLLEDGMAQRDRFGSILRGALDTPGIGRAQAFADVLQVVVGVVAFLVEIGRYRGSNCLFSSMSASPPPKCTWVSHKPGIRYLPGSLISGFGA